MSPIKFSLNSERGMILLSNLLKGDCFELLTDLQEDVTLDFSDTNKDNINTVTYDMISGIKFYDTNADQKGITLYTDNGGSFYPYKINKTFEHCKPLLKVLLKYQITNDLVNNKEMFSYNCLTWSLKMSGKFDDKTIENIKVDSYKRYISHNDLQKLGEDYHIGFKVKKYRKHNEKYRWDDVTNGKKKYIGDQNPKVIIDLCLLEKHYFLNEQIEGINKYALEHYDEIKKAYPNKPDEWILKVYRKTGNNYKIDETRAHISSYELINIISSERVPFSFDELQILPSVLLDSKAEIKDISLFDDNNFKEYKPDDKKDKSENKKTEEVEGVSPSSNAKEYIYYYADTETDVSKEYHIPFCISFKQRGQNNIKCFIGANCLDKFLNELPNNSVVYCHNLGYDSRMFSKYSIISSTDKGGKTFKQKLSYNGKNIIFKDSWSLITMKLCDFASNFDLKEGEKEMFPYNYYTMERLIGEPLTEDYRLLKRNIGVISEAGKNEIEINWNQEQFEKNISNLKLYVNEDGTPSDVKTNYFNMSEYVKFYCNQDVNILSQGFDKFHNDCLNELGIDVDEVLTISSLAQKYFDKNLFYNIDDYYKYSGIPRAFIQKAVYGGRCMTRDNKKWKTHIPLFDYDAVSLYPSAMNRLYCVKGKPKVLEPNELNTEYLLKHTAPEGEQPNEDKPISVYVVEIKITKVNKHLHFPLIVKKDPKTNTNLNTNEAEGLITVVDNITLEDFVKFQGVECEILRGYKWTGEKDFKIQEEIKKVFDKRVMYKNQHKQGLQLIYKLIMNSTYGKMIQKPIKNKTLYLQKEASKFNKKTNTWTKTKPLKKFMVKNSAKIEEINRIYDETSNLYQVKVSKPIDDYATNTLLGVQILSMSKRIMNEVMTTAEDLGIKIFYQDTDSMHIEKSRIEELEKEYFIRYGRELRGEAMGQFHNDFDELKDDYAYAYASIFNGKKCYIDMLRDTKGNEAVHYRAKGVTLIAVAKLAKDKYDNDIYEVYNELYNNKTLTFDLKEVRACIKTNNKNRQASTFDNFKRNIKFIGDGIECKEYDDKE